MKKLLILLGLLLVLSPIYSQIDSEDEQLFGSSRGADLYALKNMKEVSGDQASYSFSIKNNDVYNMKIISVNIPKGVSILIPEKTILSKSEGEIIATVYKKYLNKNDKGIFSKRIGINVKEKSINGVIITKTFFFQLTGKFVK